MVEVGDQKLDETTSLLQILFHLVLLALVVLMWEEEPLGEELLI